MQLRAIVSCDAEALSLDSINRGKPNNVHDARMRPPRLTRRREPMRIGGVSPGGVAAAGRNRFPAQRFALREC